MGLSLEQWSGGEAGGEKEASGCRTPSNGGGTKGVAGESAGACPEPPRKRKPAPGEMAQQQCTNYYTGPDIDAFFAAHNL